MNDGRGVYLYNIKGNILYQVGQRVDIKRNKRTTKLASMSAMMAIMTVLMLMIR